MKIDVGDRVKVPRYTDLQFSSGTHPSVTEIWGNVTRISDDDHYGEGIKMLEIICEDTTKAKIYRMNTEILEHEIS